MADLEMIRTEYRTLAALIAKIRENDAIGASWQATGDASGGYALDTFVVPVGTERREA